MRTRIVTVSLLLSATTCVRASATSQGDTQPELNAQAYADYQTADAALNAVYKKMMAAKAADPDATRMLVDAERQWTKFRDAECDSEADDYRGGSMVPMVRYGCAERLTKARTAELQARLDQH